MDGCMVRWIDGWIDGWMNGGIMEIVLDDKLSLIILHHQSFDWSLLLHHPQLQTVTYHHNQHPILIITTNNYIMIYSCIEE